MQNWFLNAVRYLNPKIFSSRNLNWLKRSITFFEIGVPVMIMRYLHRAPNFIAALVRPAERVLMSWDSSTIIVPLPLAFERNDRTFDSPFAVDIASMLMAKIFKPSKAKSASNSRSAFFVFP